MTVYIVDLESIPTRYTCEWKSHLPTLIKKHGHEVVVISGPEELPNNTTTGMFLNFSATNIYKSIQVEKFSRLFSDNKIKDGDYFLFTDAWHPGVINLRYMAELLGIKIKIGGLWHAGSYDKFDALGRLIGDAPWVRHAEKSFFHANDHNYFATEFHIEMFMRNLLNNNLEIENPWFEEDLKDAIGGKIDKIVRTGWPMEYMQDTLSPYKGLEKRNLILFPHRIAHEKQPDIFMDLTMQLPEYEWVVCQEQSLSKHEYHTLLGQSKIVFSANLQETLGISCYEGAVVNSIPMVPDRLSYKEMYLEEFKYPSVWTENWDSYTQNRDKLVSLIRNFMTNYESYIPTLEKQTKFLESNFFNANELLLQLT